MVCQRTSVVSTMPHLYMNQNTNLFFISSLLTSKALVKIPLKPLNLFPQDTRPHCMNGFGTQQLQVFIIVERKYNPNNYNKCLYMEILEDNILEAREPCNIYRFLSHTHMQQYNLAQRVAVRIKQRREECCKPLWIPHFRGKQDVK